MSVSVRIPTILRSYTGGAAEVSADHGTLREVIAGLDAAYPGIAGRIVDDGGKLRRFVNVYVGEEDVRFAQGLDGFRRPIRGSRLLAVCARLSPEIWPVRFVYAVIFCLVDIGRTRSLAWAGQCDRTGSALQGRSSRPEHS
jgi:molybdopterin synthase sulfur carrier subunit